MEQYTPAETKIHLPDRFEEAERPKISIIPRDIDQHGAMFDEETASVKAERFAYSLDDSGRYPTFMEGMMSSPKYEESIRSYASTLKFNEVVQARTQMINEYLSAVNEASREPDENDLRYIQNLSGPEILEVSKYDPKVVFETLFAQKVANDIIDPNGGLDIWGLRAQAYYDQKVGLENLPLPEVDDDNVFKEEIEEIIRGGTLEGFEHLMTSRGIAQNLLDDYIREQKGRSNAAYVGENLLNFIPFYNWWSTTDAIDGVFETSWLAGNNKREQVDFFYRIQDPDKARIVLEEAFKEIKAVNPVAAQEFLEAMVSYSYSDVAFHNTLNAIEAGLTVAPFPTYSGLKNAFRRAAQAPPRRTSLPGTVPSIGSTPVPTPGAAGAINAAATSAPAARAISTVLQELRDKAGLMGQRWSINDILNQAPTIANIRSVLTATPNVDALVASRMATAIENFSEESLKALLLNPSRIDKLPPELIPEILKQTTRYFEYNNPTLSNLIMDVRHIAPEDILSNVDLVEFRIGASPVDYFKTQKQAKAVAFFAQIKGHEIVQEVPGQWYIRMTKVVDETEDSFKEALLRDVNNQTPQTVANDLLGALLSADAKVSANTAADLKKAVYGRSAAAKFLKEQVKALGRFTKSEKRALRDFITRETTQFNPVTKVPGVSVKNQTELELAWQNQFNRLPTEKETLGYWLFKSVHEQDLLARNITLWKQQSAIGAENHLIQIPGGLPGLFSTTGVKGKLIGGIDAQRNPTSGIPWKEGQKNTNILVIRENGQFEWVNKAFASKAEIDEIEKLVTAQDYKTIQLSPWGKDELQQILKAIPASTRPKIPDGSFNFIVAKNIRSTNLDLKQFNAKDGWHVRMKDGYYVSQANVQEARGASGAIETIYYGDKNAYHFLTSRDAEAIGTLMEDARRLLKLALLNGLKAGWKKRAEFVAYKDFIENHTPFDVDDFMKQFTVVNPNGAFDIEQPFLVRGTNERLAEAHNFNAMYTNFSDELANEYNFYRGKVDMEYVRERGQILDTFVRTGNYETPTWVARPAEILDPFQTLEEAAKRLVTGPYLEDVKQKTADLLVREFRHLFDLDEDALRWSPYEAIVNYKKYLNKNADPRVVSRFRGARRALMEVVGYETPLAQKANLIKRNISESMADLFGRRYGINASQRAFNFTENLWKISIMDDPAQFIRSAAFHTKIGLFNPLQWLMQAQSVVHTMALEGPVNGFKGLAGGSLMRLALVNPKMAKVMANKAKAFGWKPEEFEEAMNVLRTTGFHRVGREHGSFSDVENTKVFTTKAGEMLDTATFFFKEGELINRLTAWNAAYLRWKVANPGKELKIDADISKVLNRADLLTMNMSQASNAIWQKGFAGIPTQFASFQARFMEQMLGRRLTATEKLKAFSAYSLLYGLPIGAGGAVLGGAWPVHKDIQAALLDRGIDVSETVVGDIFSKGLLDVVGNSLTDQDLNWSERYGPGGNPLFRDLWNGNTTVFEAVAGAGGKTLGGEHGDGVVFGAFGVLGTAIAATVSEEDDFLPLVKERAIHWATNVSALNNAYKMFNGIHKGKYISRSGVEMDDITIKDAIISGFFGTQPQDIADAFVIFENSKNIKEINRDAEKQYKKYFKMALENRDSPKDFTIYMGLAKDSLLGLNPKVKRDILANAMKDNETLVESAYDTFSKESPEKLKMYIKRLQKEKLKDLQ